MNVLKINKTNITSAEFDVVTEKFIDTNIKELSFPFTRYFSQVIELSDDLTVEDLMKHIENYSDVIDFCFYSYLDGVSIKEYCTLMAKETEKKSFVDNIELFWSTELNGDEYSLFGVFHGVVTSKENMSKVEEIGVNSFRMDLTPINEWKHCGLILDDTIRASVGSEDGNNSIIKLKNRWTLFELIQYFVFNLTCYGTVEEQRLEIEEFDANTKKYDGFRVDPEFADKLNKEELCLFIEEVEKQIQINVDMLNEAVENEDFEAAKKIKEEEVDLKAELSKMKKRVKELGK